MSFLHLHIMRAVALSIKPWEGVGNRGHVIKFLLLLVTVVLYEFRLNIHKDRTLIK